MCVAVIACMHAMQHAGSDPMASAHLLTSGMRDRRSRDDAQMCSELWIRAKYDYKRFLQPRTSVSVPAVAPPSPTPTLRSARVRVRRRAGGAKRTRCERRAVGVCA
jgi:hypothetical protein